jgi:hypothetical protein
MADSRPTTIVDLEPEPDPQTESADLTVLLENLRAAAGRSDHNPNTLQSKIHEMLAYHDLVERANAEKAANMGIDLDAVIAKWAAKNTSPFLSGTLPPAGALEDVSTPDMDEPMEDVTSAEGTAYSPRHDALYDSGSPMDMSSPVTDGSPVDQATQKAEESFDKNSNAKAYAQQITYVRSSSAKKRHSLHRSVTKAEKRQRNINRLRTQHAPDRQERSSQSLKPVNVSPLPGFTYTQSAAAVATPAVDHMPSLFVSPADRYPVQPLPEWYTDIKDKGFQMNQISRKKPPALVSLDVLKACIRRCESIANRTPHLGTWELTQAFDELRHQVHKAEIVVEVNKYTIKKARMIDVQIGLPRIFMEDARFPPDLKADSYQLYLRWLREDFSQDLLRGIKTVKGPNRGSDQLDLDYKKKHPADAKRYGDNGLVLGQWWPSQLCTLRDGAHGSSQGGIFGEKEKGAYSIVLSGGGGYNDQDNGNSIVYSGTEGKSFTPTEATLQMVTSARLRNEIRVIRSSRLLQKNVYRPEVGLRYDGLYTIQSFKVLDMEKQIHEFKLQRCPGQEPIRCGDGAASRPTKFEIAEYHKLKGRV